MIRSTLNYHIGHLFKQLEYRLITFKNNKAVGRAFVYDSPLTPFSRTVAFTKDHSLITASFVFALIGMSLMVLLKPVNFSKQTPIKFEIDKQIEKKLINIPPPADLLEKKRVPTITRVSRENFLNKTPAFTLLVNKRTKKLFVTEEKENGYLVVEEFPISLGIAPGNKFFEGDMKTPEGSYSLIDLKTDDELPAKYGPYAAVLNYPNKEDLRQGKTGSGIWIHGTGENQLTPDTQGCVELSDSNLLKLFSYISKNTKIIITPDNIDLTPQENIVQKNLVRFATSS